MASNRIRLATGLAATGLIGGCATSGASGDAIVAVSGNALIETDGQSFRDLDHDGKLTPYEDWRLSPQQRVDDLVPRMTLAEKVGTLMHGTLPSDDKGYDLTATGKVLNERKVTSFITRLSLRPEEVARQNNDVQALAETTRLGIPVTISTDPRNHFQYVFGASVGGSGVTQWPDLPGFAALRDPELVRRFGDIARKEYRAMGIQMALSPQLDLLTEPRWPRGTGTFGSNAKLVSELGAAYVAGFQGGSDGLAKDGVATVVKHWVGYGAQPEGFDGHNYYGRFARPGASFEDHVEAFRGAFAASAAAVMPAYPIMQDLTLNGQKVEQVGPGFSKELLEGLLRGREKYDGMILSDWAITRDCPVGCSAPTAERPQKPQDIATSWGVENLTVRQRYVKGLNAGLDQFGGVDDVAPLLEAVEAGEVSEERIDQSVRRVMLLKFEMGLFDNPFVDPARARPASPDDYALAAQTQRRSQVLLQDRDGLLPLASEKKKVWLFGMSAEAAKSAGLEVVATPEEADFAIIRAESPSEMLHPNHFFGSRQKEGRLDYRDGDAAYDALKQAKAAGKLSIFAIFLDRPAILTNIQDQADVILANFGASDEAVLDVVQGEAKAKGKLPFELPRSMDAVIRQDPGAADDSENPLYPFGAGIIR